MNEATLTNSSNANFRDEQSIPTKKQSEKPTVEIYRIYDHRDQRDFMNAVRKMASTEGAYVRQIPGTRYGSDLFIVASRPLSLRAGERAFRMDELALVVEALKQGAYVDEVWGYYEVSEADLARAAKKAGKLLPRGWRVQVDKNNEALAAERADYNAKLLALNRESDRTVDAMKWVKTKSIPASNVNKATAAKAS